MLGEGGKEGRLSFEILQIVNFSDNAMLQFYPT